MTFIYRIFYHLINILCDQFTIFFKYIGVNEDISKPLSLSLTVLITSIIAFIVFQKVKHLYLNWRAAKKLVDFDYKSRDIQQKRELFIPTRFQNQSPTKEEEPKFSHKFVSKSPLIPFFIKIAFAGKKESDKFYLVLADSGMGKTTFMINLYLKYNSLFNLRLKRKMRLFAFGDSKILESIKEIKKDEARDTILLLDAFDEYKALLAPEKPDGLSDDDRFRKILDEVVESVQNFREVVITSRTQYFPGQEDEPYELNITRFGGDGFHKLAKLYISPFEEKEITRYLRKKYGVLRFWNWKKKKTAKAIVERSPKLMVRPMLLSYIDLLVDSDKSFDTTYQIYETLIEKWIEREAGKRKPKLKNREKFKRDLGDFSRLAALEIYNERKDKNLLSKKEAVAICEQNDIDLQSYEITGQSLLTRDASGNWKFAHKSILEFFLAREAINDLRFFIEVWKDDFYGIDMTKVFYQEKGEWAFVIGDYKSSLEKYETLIEKWLEHEAEKRKEWLFTRNMPVFSHQSAVAVYQNGNQFLPKEQAVEIAERNDINLEQGKTVGQSLFVRDENGNWNFVHDSVTQFFLAQEAVEKYEFGINMNTDEMDMIMAFADEIQPLNYLNFVFVKGGSFMMGSSPDDEKADDAEKSQHKVTVSDCCIGKFPVTQKQWRDVMGSDPEELRFTGRDNCPVEGVSWNDAQEFIEKLKTKTGKTFRLPSEAEWEYAARGGNKSKGFKFSGSDNLDEVGWYKKNLKNKTQPVAQKNSNELGVYDMSGNVWEWCQDKWYVPYEGAPNDGSAWESGEGSLRVLRGGSWNNRERICRVAIRFRYDPGIRVDDVGFRLVLVP